MHCFLFNTHCIWLKQEMPTYVTNALKYLSRFGCMELMTWRHSNKLAFFDKEQVNFVDNIKS